jgi:HAD superfamily hydrolase (TIGR01509 family)
MLKALIFDVDGTLADTELAHLAAFNHAFQEGGVKAVWSVDEYKQLLRIAGGKERIRHYLTYADPGFQRLTERAQQQTIEGLHHLKTKAYEQAVEDGKVAMRPGVVALIQEAAQWNLALAIATTTTPVNISALLGKHLGAHWKHYFAVVEDAATAPLKKPHPQVYVQALAKLGLPARDCLAFEDSENGLRAALAAQIACIVTPNAFTKADDFSGALLELPSLEDIRVTKLLDLHATADITKNTPISN